VAGVVGAVDEIGCPEPNGFAGDRPPNKSSDRHGNPAFLSALEAIAKSCIPPNSTKNKTTQIGIRQFKIKNSKLKVEDDSIPEFSVTVICITA
jgi:hypothetical protein